MFLAFETATIAQREFETNKQTDGQEKRKNAFISKPVNSYFILIKQGRVNLFSPVFWCPDLVQWTQTIPSLLVTESTRLLTQLGLRSESDHNKIGQPTQCPQIISQ